MSLSISHRLHKRDVRVDESLSSKNNGPGVNRRAR